MMIVQSLIVRLYKKSLMNRRLGGGKDDYPTALFGIQHTHQHVVSLREQAPLKSFEKEGIICQT